MKKVIFFSHSQALGGAELSLLDLLERIDRRVFEPVLLTSGAGSLADRAARLSTEIIEVKIPPNVLNWQRGGPFRTVMIWSAFGSVFKLAKVLEAQRPAVLYTHSQKAHILGGLAGRLCGMPVVWHLREILDRPGLRRFMSFLSFFVPSKIICVSRAVAEQLPQAVRVQKTEVVPNGMDVSVLRSQATDRGSSIRTKLGLPPDSPLIAMIARIAPGKGQHIFIEMARRVVEVYPAARFLIAGGPLFGDETCLEALRRQVGEKGLDGKVFFAGHLENPLPAMAEADVLVHCPVVPEGFGRSVAEAMALGVPVISVRAGGIPELIDNGVSGLLIEPGDAEGLEKAVVRLLSDRALAVRLVRAARERIETRFTMEASITAIERTLLEV